MSDTADLHSKLLGYLAGEFARKEGRQCIGVDLLYAPGGGFKDDEIRKWVRQDDPELFDNFANVEKLVTQIIEIAQGEVDAKPAGKHRFVVRTHQHLGGRATQSFALWPTYNGSGDETALVPGGGGIPGVSRSDAGVISNHASQLMRINAQMFEGTIRVLGQQNAHLQEANMRLLTENTDLRRKLEDAESNKMEREFAIAMEVEKNQRTKVGFEKLMQLGSIAVAKIGGGNDAKGNPSGEAALMLIGEFGKSLRKEQIDVLMNTLDMGQKLMFMEIMGMVSPPEQNEPSAPKGINGAVGTPGTSP